MWRRWWTRVTTLQKPNTTVYRNENHAIQDLRDALNSKISEIDQLSPGGEPLKFQHTLREPRQGYHSEFGHPATEVTFRSVMLVVVRLGNGKLHLLHFSPRLR